MVTRSSPKTIDRQGAKPPYRGDLDGLRAVAILLVVAFHVGLRGFDGGFIGVDVFFVISGFLITGKLLATVEGTGRVSLRGFWAGRIRRLVPALSLMVAATVVAALVVLPRVNWQQLGVQAGAAALYVSNLLFARDARDYFAPDINRSPFLHTWSLGVEEQFYLLWPLLFAGVCWLVARRSRRTHELRTSLLVAFSALFIVSFVWNIRLSSSGDPWAFFGLPTRAWEFAAAGLLAAIPLPAALHGRIARTSTAAVGLAVLAVAVLTVQQGSSYPGWAAALPVGATLLLIAGGDPTTDDITVFGRALAASPMRWLGRTSYSWYLWHWPFIVLGTAAVARNSTRFRLAFAAASLPVAVLAHHFVENPVRFSRRLIRSTALTYGLGALATLIVVVLAAGTVRAGHPVGQTLQGRVAAARAQTRQYECDSQMTGAGGATYCVSGQVDSDRTVMLIGDSHARHWKQAMARAATDLHLRLIDRYRGSCPSVGVTIAGANRLIGNETISCSEFQQQNLALIDELDPDVVIISNSAGYASGIRDTDGATPSLDGRDRLWEEATRELLLDLRRRDITPIMMIDNPGAPFDPVECISQHGATAPCEFPRDRSVRDLQELASAEARARAAVGPIPTFSVQDVVCPPSSRTCRVEIDGQLVFADSGHLTKEFTLTQVPALENVLQEALQRPPPG